MVKKIKQAIQGLLYQRVYRSYLAEVDKQKDLFRQWRKDNGEDETGLLRGVKWVKPDREPGAVSEEVEIPEFKGKKCILVPIQSLVGDGFLAQFRVRLHQEKKKSYVVFYDERGFFAHSAGRQIEGFMKEHPYVQIAYTGENCVDDENYSYDPWFKPGWSPDALRSYQYFGHLVIVRKQFLMQLPESVWSDSLISDAEANFYRLLLGMTDHLLQKRWIRANDTEKEIAVIDHFLFHMAQEVPDLTFDQIGYGKLPVTDGILAFKQEIKKAVVSVVIPSKDNPEVLFTCVSTLVEKTDRKYEGISLDFDIIVVDNGSSEENKAKVEQMASRFGFTYLYEPMEFNFSRMCNLGAQKAKGNYLLLLNDDMEIVQGDWLGKMLCYAAMPHVGAVGAKLLYPGTDLIQHGGVCNMKVGPGHIMLKMHDSEILFHGLNKNVIDCQAVTAACLLIRKSLFTEIGGLCEDIAIAYNDVDMNFTLFERGFYNVQCNHVILYHHESLSRGDDTKNEEKWLRSLKERKLLYDRHPNLRGNDEFRTVYTFLHEYEKKPFIVSLKKWNKPEPVKWTNETLQVTMEHIHTEKKTELDDTGDLALFLGWEYCLGLDNCRFKRYMFFFGEKGNNFVAELPYFLRKDVLEILPDEKNVALAGFAMRVDKDTVPADTYRLGVLASDMCSNLKLYRKLDMTWTVDEKEKEK